MKVLPQHSRYWLNTELFSQNSEGEGTDIMRIARLAGVRRAVSNFVTILSGKNVPVEFSSGAQSYTDGKRVVISADDDPERFDVMVGLALHEASHILLTDFRFLKALEPIRTRLLMHRELGYNPEGKALEPSPEEALFGPVLASTLGSMVWSQAGPVVRGPRLMTESQALAGWQMMTDLQTLMNILEDRRIDKHVYGRARGYRPYYQALYNRYFFTSEIGKNLRFNPKWRELSVENYINRLLFAFHPDAKPDAMPGLQTLIDMMDMRTIERVGPEHDPKYTGFAGNVSPRPLPLDIRNVSPPCAGYIDTPAWQSTFTLRNMPILWQEATKLYAQILRYASIARQNSGEKEPGSAGKDHPMVDQAMQNPQALDGLPNLDTGAAPVPVEMDTKGKGKLLREVEGEYNETKAKKELQEAKKVMTGEAKKKKLTKGDAAAVAALEAADAQLVDLKGEGVPGGKCMVTRKMTDELLDQEWFIFKRWNWRNNTYRDGLAERTIAAGKRMGQVLVHRLQVRNDPVMTKQTRLAQGGLDRRLLAQLGMELTSVFQKSRIDTHKPAMLHLSIDASGSMHGKKWDRVRTIATALAYAGSKLSSVDTVISIRGGTDMAIVSVIFDSRKDQFGRFVHFMRILEPSGATPEGLCFKATMNMVTECVATHDVYFINFSDGEPAFQVYPNAQLGGKGRGGRGSRYPSMYYSGEVAYKHTRLMVNMMRDAGVRVLSYFISDYALSDTSGTAQAFRWMYGEDAVFVNVENAGEVIRTLNKVLIKRGT